MQPRGRRVAAGFVSTNNIQVMFTTDFHPGIDPSNQHMYCRYLISDQLSVNGSSYVGLMQLWSLRLYVLINTCVCVCVCVGTLLIRILHMGGHGFVCFLQHALGFGCWHVLGDTCQTHGSTHFQFESGVWCLCLVSMAAVY